MDPLQKRSFTGFLSRSGTDRSSEPTVISDLSSLEIEISDNEKGPLGLTTVHNPPEIAPTVDIVFIHGLGGGSRKTWSYSAHPSHFWPQAWLPADTDFQDVRIHSFGYKAEWGERRQSSLNIHDFAQALLGELRNHPGIRRNHTRLIFIGHSMGGCIAKKTYILARQDPTCKELAGRVHSMFFLGTPHRGSDLAAVLENMLVVAWGKKPFVTDLTPNSYTLSEINDAFRHVASDLRLWSFYETLPVRSKLISRIVVDKYSATLGYHNEEIAAVNADHRHVCKFDSQADPNYRTLRNAIHTAIDMIKAPVPRIVLPRTEDTSHHEISDISPIDINSRLRSLLGLREESEDDFTSLQLLKEPGSCQWFTEQIAFASWKAQRGAGILWLLGRPAAGKSILSSHIIEQLRSSGAHCSYFFFRHGKSGKSALSDCFRALAFQMAMLDKAMRAKLLELQGDDLSWDKADESTFWRKIFTSCMFKVPTISQHFWVIDGVDECANFHAIFSKRLLVTLPDGLRLFATSRNLEEVGRGLAALGPKSQTIALTDADTFDDMRLFLTSRLKELDRLDSDESREIMCEKILRKSSGSFLWVRLVLQEFENAWTQEAMEAVLQEVPADLHAVYSRMIHSVESDRKRVKLAKSILTWVILASRPLTTDELRCAVKLDINQTLQNMAKAIPSLCGQLVFVDQSGRVHMIHETAREFLVSGGLSSPLAIHKTESHTKIGHMLLQYLSGDVLKSQQERPAKIRGFAKPSNAMPLDSALLEYACSFFSDHLYRCTSEDDDLMDQLCNFLKSHNVLSWIEHVAKAHDLSDIARTAMNLREYLGRRTKYVPPTDPTVHLVDSWVVDLIRVAAKFRSQLLACPSSIHCLIPPLCPPDSMISRTFGRDNRASSLVVDGLPTGGWDDCLIRIDFHRGQTTCISHGDRFFAIGLSTGQISLYEQNSVQRLQNFTHPERVRILAFSLNDQYLISCGTKHVLMFDPKAGVIIQSLQIQSAPLAISFLGVDELLFVFPSSELTKWNLESGVVDTISWKETDDNYYPTSLDDIPEQPPSRATFLTTTDEVMMAVGYRNYPVLVWNALELRLLGKCVTETNNGIDDMVFNPNPDIVSLVVSYNDGNLCVFDYSTMALNFTRNSVFAHSIACSPDGHSLITGSSQGIIEVYEFDMDYSGNMVLTLIYRINSFDDSIRDLAFSFDGLRFVDVHGQQCRVWAPTALVRKDNELESISDVVPLPPKTISTTDSPVCADITSPLVSCREGAYFMAGKSDGTVALFSAVNARELCVLYQHARGVSVVDIAIKETKNLLVSADDSGRILAVEMPTTMLEGQSQKMVSVQFVLDRRSETAVQRLLINAAGDRLLVTGRDVDQLWELPSGNSIGTRPVARNRASSVSGDTVSTLAGERDTVAPSVVGSSVVQHPTNRDWFMMLAWDVVRIFTWSEFLEVTPPDGIQVERSMTSLNPLSSPSMTVSFHSGPDCVIEHLQDPTSRASHLLIWPSETFDPQAHSPPPMQQPALDAVSPAVLSVLGIIGHSTLVFLDINLWICTIELQTSKQASSRSPSPSRSIFRPSLSSRSGSGSGSGSLSAASGGNDGKIYARRHFFALSEWRDPSRGLRCAMTETTQRRGGSRNFVFTDGHRVVVVKGGLEFSESVELCRTGSTRSGVGSAAVQHVWSSVSGSMQRRASIL